TRAARARRVSFEPRRPTRGRITGNREPAHGTRVETRRDGATTLVGPTRRPRQRRCVDTTNALSYAREAHARALACSGAGGRLDHRSGSASTVVAARALPLRRTL